jgi:hypothetical protein
MYRIYLSSYPTTLYFIFMIAQPIYKRFMIGNKILGYSGNTYQTGAGTLIRFMSDNIPIGPFPGCTWDEYVDDLLPRLRPHHDDNKVSPAMTIPYNEDECLECAANTEYQFCSRECWCQNALRVLESNPILHNRFVREFATDDDPRLFQC